MVKKITPATKPAEKEEVEKKIPKAKKTAEAVEKTPAVKKTAEKKEVKEKAVKESKGDVLSLAELCQELELDPKNARIKLRKSEIEKPEGGRWEWPLGSKEAERVRDVLSA